ncbi:MAG: DUF4349 domain-containing protein [Cryomorphaceae bacterium]|nr:DUF4349 domain-containing protein [Cryomorphaceae bacterium]
MKNFITIPLVFLLFIVFLSCKSQKSYGPNMYSDPVTAETSNDKKGGLEFERIVIYAASLTLAVDKPDSVAKYLKELAVAYKGYPKEFGTNRVVMRVPSNQLTEILQKIESMGRVERRRVSGEDVTEAYYDHKIRLENALKSRERYLALLDRARTVEETIKVERELERLNEVIDLHKGRIQRFEHLAEFSTVSVSIKERVKPGVLGYLGIGVYRSVRWLFVRN